MRGWWQSWWHLWLRLWKESHVSFPLAVVLSVALLLVSEFSYRRSTDIAHELDAAIDARLVVQQVLRTVLDAETGQRGYLITGEAKYLDPYRYAAVQLDDKLKTLRERYNNSGAGANAFGELERVIRLKTSELSRTIALRAAGNDSWQSIMESDAGQYQMDAIRDLSEQLKTIETGVIDSRRKLLNRTLLISRITIAAMVSVSLLAFALYLRQVNELDRVRESNRQRLLRDKEELEQKVRDRTQSLLRLNLHLLTVREEERARVARDLHDELGALLVAAKLDLARIKSHLGSTDAYIDERLRHLGDALNSGISFKRRIIEDLYPSALSKLGLVAAIEILAKEFAERAGVKIACALEPVELPESHELTIYRLIQEALTNIAKYSHAVRVDIALASDEERVTVSVRDDGIGFDPVATPASAHGLEGMKYRVAAHAGELSIRSAVGRGTQITARIPLQHQQALS